MCGDSWELWNSFCLLCEHHSQLSIVLDVLIRSNADASNEMLRSNVTIVNCYDKDYSLVTIRCKNQPKLLFDILCTLKDMKFVIFHANFDAKGKEAYQVEKNDVTEAFMLLEVANSQQKITPLGPSTWTSLPLEFL